MRLFWSKFYAAQYMVPALKTDQHYSYGSFLLLHAVVLDTLEGDFHIRMFIFILQQALTASSYDF
jgi:hypothetical protein